MAIHTVTARTDDYRRRAVRLELDDDARELCVIDVGTGKTETVKQFWFIYGRGRTLDFGYGHRYLVDGDDLDVAPDFARRADLVKRGKPFNPPDPPPAKPHRRPSAVEHVLGLLGTSVFLGALLGGAVFLGLGLFMHQSIPVFIPEPADCLGGSDDLRCLAWAQANPDDVDCGTFLQPIIDEFVMTAADERECRELHDEALSGTLKLSIGAGAVAAVVALVALHTRL